MRNQNKMSKKAEQIKDNRIHALNQLELYYLQNFCENKEEGTPFDHLVCTTLNEMRYDIEINYNKYILKKEIKPIGSVPLDQAKNKELDTK